MSSNPTLDEGESPKIREEIRNSILPRLEQEGRDPTVKDVYLSEVHALEKKYSVNYNTAKKAWDKVLREHGKKEPEKKVTETKEGGARVEVSTDAKRREKKEGEERTEDTTRTTEPKTPEEKKALMAKMFASMHQAPCELIYNLAEQAWGVKINRPDIKDGKQLDFDDPTNPYNRAGVLWAEVCEAYGIELPKILLLIGAASESAVIIAMPLMQAQGELKKRDKANSPQGEQTSNA